LPVISDPALGAVYALAAALAWSVTSLLVRSLIGDYGSVTINAVRWTVAGVLLVACVLLRDGAAALVTMSWQTFGLLALSVVCIAVGDTVFFEGTHAIGVGRAMTIATIYPIGAALLAVAFFDETFTTAVAIGSVLTLAGVAAIVGSRPGEMEGDRLWSGVWLTVLAAAVWAVSTAVMKPPLREIEPLTAQAIRLPMASALLWLTPWARGAAKNLRNGGRRPLVRIGVLSMVTAASSVFFVASLKYAGVTIGAVLSSTAPLFAIPLGVIFLGERVSALMIAGAIIATAGIVVLQL
jgi:drug/metabolite transporter (DMT)-like permease